MWCAEKEPKPEINRTVRFLETPTLSTQKPYEILHSRGHVRVGFWARADPGFICSGPAQSTYFCPLYGY